MPSTKQQFVITGPDKNGYAIRDTVSDEYIVDGIDNGLDAREHEFRANSGVLLNLYVEHPDGGYNEQYADPVDAITEFDSLVEMYPDVYARLHWLDDHDLIVREHTPTRQP